MAAAGETVARRHPARGMQHPAAELAEAHTLRPDPVRRDILTRLCNVDGDLTAWRFAVEDDPLDIARFAALVCLDDPADAASPLGIAVGLRSTEAITQSAAARLLGVTRQCVTQAITAGTLQATPDRRVYRRAVAARLARKA